MSPIMVRQWYNEYENIDLGQPVQQRTYIWLVSPDPMLLESYSAEMLYRLPHSKPFSPWHALTPLGFQE